MPDLFRFIPEKRRFVPGKMIQLSKKTIIEMQKEGKIHGKNMLGMS